MAADEMGDPQAFATLIRLGDVALAQVLAGRLESEGIGTFLPDGQMASQAWHLNRAIGGIRLQVRQVDLARAKEILAAFEGTKAKDIVFEADLEDGAGSTGELEVIGVGDRLAYRSLRVALVALWLMGLLHPYPLFLAVQALRQKDLTSWGRGRAWLAFVISLAGCGSLAWMVYACVRRLR